jgi:hippurate hydrolase
MQPAVVTVGAMHAGHANNVIPETARLELSVRALDPQVRVDLERRIKALVTAQAQSFGVCADVDWRPGYAVLVNDAHQTARALAVAQKHFPAEQIEPNGPMLTGSEDFAFMLEKVPGCYLFIGNGLGDEPGGCMVHNPAYDFNDDNIGTGASYWVALVHELLSPTDTQETR